MLEEIDTLKFPETSYSHHQSHETLLPQRKSLALQSHTERPHFH